MCLVLCCVFLQNILVKMLLVRMILLSFVHPVRYCSLIPFSIDSANSTFQCLRQERKFRSQNSLFIPLHELSFFPHLWLGVGATCLRASTWSLRLSAEGCSAPTSHFLLYADFRQPSLPTLLILMSQMAGFSLPPKAAVSPCPPHQHFPCLQGHHMVRT